jgi:hypothetical protein
MSGRASRLPRVDLGGSGDVAFTPYPHYGSAFGPAEYGVLNENKHAEALLAGFGALAMIRYYANGTVNPCVRARGARINIPTYLRDAKQRSGPWFQHNNESSLVHRTPERDARTPNWGPRPPKVRRPARDRGWSNSSCTQATSRAQIIVDRILCPRPTVHGHRARGRLCTLPILGEKP